MPSFKGAPRPQVFEILKRLPRTNCRAWGEPTCMVFATRLAEGAKGIAACPPLDDAQRRELGLYMGGF